MIFLDSKFSIQGQFIVTIFSVRHSVGCCLLMLSTSQMTVLIFIVHDAIGLISGLT